MIANKIAYWRTKANDGEGVSQAHLARRVGVGRSFITKLEKGVAQPGAELMLRIAAYLKKPVESIFWRINVAPSVQSEAMPVSQSEASPVTTLPGKSGVERGGDSA